MAKTSNLRVDPVLRKNAEVIYKAFGITVTDAVNMFFAKSIMENGIPFDLKQPRYNKETEAAMEEGDKILQGLQESAFNGLVNELFKNLDT